jgi:hypothetical protein
MIRSELIRVNIHNTGRIPILNIPGPKYNMTISLGIYRLLRRHPAVIMRTVEEDEILAKQNAPIQKVDPKISKLTLEDAIKIVEKSTEKQPLTTQELSETLKVDIKKTDNMQALERLKIEDSYTQPQKEVTKTELDLAIDARISELPEEPEDDFNLAQSFGNSEIAKSVVRKYKQRDLKLMNKADLKKILNVERGYKIGDKYYGGYHDGHTALVKFILESQEEN